jgi:hypothetical protein
MGREAGALPGMAPADLAPFPVYIHWHGPVWTSELDYEELQPRGASRGPAQTFTLRAIMT